MASQDIRYSYTAEWRDPKTDVLWKYELYVYPETNEVEMCFSAVYKRCAALKQSLEYKMSSFLDVRSRKLFLRRCSLDGVTLVPELLRPGSRVDILSRQLRIIDYADIFTKDELAHRQERTLAMIKPDAVEQMPRIIDMILQAGFIIGELRMCKLSQSEAAAFYEMHQGKEFFARLLDFMTSGRVVAMELLAAGAVERWRRLLGPTDSDLARLQDPGSIRALFGSNKTQNACHGSDSQQSASIECNFFFFSSQVGSCWGRHKSSLCIVKNHALTRKSLIPILEQLSSHFKITAAQMCHFTTARAHDLLEVYKGVLPLSEYNSMAQELCAGNTLALEISHADDNDTSSPAEALREVCGPLDPITAQAVRPHSLRARFGVSKVQNAVYCTDLEEDTEMEIGKTFSIL